MARGDRPDRLGRGTCGTPRWMVSKEIGGGIADRSRLALLPPSNDVERPSSGGRDHRPMLRRRHRGERVCVPDR